MQTILITTDFSPGSQNAADYAVSLARFFDARLVLVHVFNHRINVAGPTYPAKELELLREEVLSRLESEKNRLLASGVVNPEITCLAEQGDVLMTVMRLADKEGAEIVIAGMHGSSGNLKKTLMGNVAMVFATNLDVPTLIVPFEAKYKPIKRITFACNFIFDEGSTILYFARTLAKEFDAVLEILNVTIGEMETVPSEAQFYVESKLRDTDHVTILLHNDDVAEALVHYFEKNNTGLLMLHPRKHNLFDKMFAPGVSRKVAERVKVPILLVR